MKKLIALLLALVMVIGLFAACGKKDVSDDKKSSDDEEETTEGTGETGETDEGEVEDPTVPAPSGPAGQYDSSLEQIAISKYSAYTILADGYTYRGENDKYGISNLDGSFDSGAIYENVTTLGDYFYVQTKSYEDPENLDSINCSGVIDCNGNQIVPAEYAHLKELGEYYVQAYKVTGITEDASNYLIRLSKNAFSMSAVEGDTLYVGQWDVYDLRTGKAIPGFTGTDNGLIYVNGEVLSYTVDGVRISKNAAGQDIPNDGRILLDGSYIPKGESTVYGPDMQKRFDIGTDGYDVFAWEKGYYVLSNYTGGKSFVIADESGNVLSTTFSERPIVMEGGLVGLESGVYTMEGDLVLDKPYYISYYHDGCWLIRDKDKNVYYVDSDLNVETICQLDDEYVQSLNGTNFVVTKRENNVNYYYSLTQKKFVEGSIREIGIAELEYDDDTAALVDTNTGKELISGYIRYNVAINAENRYTIYAYTMDANYNTYCEIFVIE